jgi:hypothetical protein
VSPAPVPARDNVQDSTKSRWEVVVPTRACRTTFTALRRESGTGTAGSWLNTALASSDTACPLTTMPDTHVNHTVNFTHTHAKQQVSKEK